MARLLFEWSSDSMSLGRKVCLCIVIRRFSCLHVLTSSSYNDNANLSGDDYRCIDYFNPVDGDEVPVPHFGLALTVEQFHDLAERVRKAGIKFIIEPHLRFKGAPGEQWTMFFKDPRYAVLMCTT